MWNIKKVPSHIYQLSNAGYHYLLIAFYEKSEKPKLLSSEGSMYCGYQKYYDQHVTRQRAMSRHTVPKSACITTMSRYMVNFRVPLRN